MIKLYVASSCTSCRKARKWLTDNKLKFKEINLKTGLSRDALIEILSYTDRGTDDIVSTQSVLYQELKLDFSKMKFETFVKTIEAYPLLLKRPIILRKNLVQFGFNEDEVRAFLPRDFRKFQLSDALTEIKERWNDDNIY